MSPAAIQEPPTMTALQTERYYPQVTTGHPRLDLVGSYAFTGILAAGCTASGLATALTAAGTIAALTGDPVTQLVCTPVLATATIHLTRYTAALARAIRRRA